MRTVVFAAESADFAEIGYSCQGKAAIRIRRKRRFAGE
jgi:hypothetical protein